MGTLRESGKRKVKSENRTGEPGKLWSKKTPAAVAAGVQG